MYKTLYIAGSKWPADEAACMQGCTLHDHHYHNNYYMHGKGIHVAALCHKLNSMLYAHCLDETTC